MSAFGRKADVQIGKTWVKLGSASGRQCSDLPSTTSCLTNGHYSDTPINDLALDIPRLVNYFVEVVDIPDDFFEHT